MELSAERWREGGEGPPIIECSLVAMLPTVLWARARKKREGRLKIEHLSLVCQLKLDFNFHNTVS
jgi:hypothetical protein